MNKEELEKVEQLIEQKNSEELKGLLSGLHPADIAELCNELDAEEARFIYLLLDNETAADVLIEMDEDARKDFLEILPSETIAKRFVDYMDSDDAVDIIREMDELFIALTNRSASRKLRCIYPEPGYRQGK